MSVRFQQKRDTAANWTASDPTLLSGEIGYETDTGKFKMGDGTTAWNSLIYAGGGSIFGGETAGLLHSDGTGNISAGSLYVSEYKAFFIED